ncbi:MAG: beta-lactamase family protein [Alphaproteobacteria bacterium]|nr:beta-lactamase family protein [Alphaproteobacteria bacterium]
MSKVFLTALALALAIFASPSAHADAALQVFLEQTLAAARQKDQLPAAAALVQINGKIEAEAVVGVRALGQPELATTNDRWHIGSDTKAFTSTLIARLVEQNVLHFEDTLASSFPAIAKDMNPAYRNVTLAQLLTHTSGLPPLTDDRDLPPFLAAIATAKDVRGQRAAIARTYLTQPPASKAGEYEYSNLGYIIAGAIAEARTGKAWEDLIREQIFNPLGIKNAGFGVPASPGKADQPWGHNEIGGKLVPLDPSNPDGDNPAALGPAGTINIALKDWLLFAQDHLDGAHGHGKLLKAETYRKLHTPVTENYAFGWGSKLGPDGAPLLLTHSGSNGFWLADIRIMPKHDMIFLVVTNAGNEAANQAIQDIGKPLRDRLKPFD